MKKKKKQNISHDEKGLPLLLPGALRGWTASAKLPLLLLLLLLSLPPLFAAAESNLERIAPVPTPAAAAAVGDVMGDSPKLPPPTALPLGLPLPLVQLPLPKLPQPPAPPLPSAPDPPASSSELPSADAEEPPEDASAADAADAGAAPPFRAAAGSCCSLLALLCSLLFLEKGTYPATDARSGGWTRRASAAAEARRAAAPATAAPAATARRRLCLSFCFSLAAAAASASPRRPGGGGAVVAGGGEGAGVVVAMGIGVGGGFVIAGGVVVAGGIVAGGEGVVVGGGGGVGGGGVGVRKTTFATCVPGLGPLAPPKEVTTALSAPATEGGVESATSSVVAVAAVTAPAAPFESETVLATGELASNPEPEIVSSRGVVLVVGSGLTRTGKSAALSATAGGATTAAICLAAPLPPPKDVTTAVRGPRPVGGVVKERDSDVAVAETTVDEAPRPRETEFPLPPPPPSEASKPEPEIVSVGALRAIFVPRSWITAGAGTTVASCTAETSSLEIPKEVTEATDSGPSGSGEGKVTVREVWVAAATVFAIAGWKLTALPAGEDASKPEPEITSCVALLASFFAAPTETLGRARTVATCTKAPLEPPSAAHAARLVTRADSGPGVVGGCWNCSVSL